MAWLEGELQLGRKGGKVIDWERGELGRRRSQMYSWMDDNRVLQTSKQASGTWKQVID